MSYTKYEPETGRITNCTKHNPKKNVEGYSDPTPYVAIKHIDEQQNSDSDDCVRFKRLLKAIWCVCEAAGFRMEGRIVLRDVRTGRVWK